MYERVLMGELFLKKNKSIQFTACTKLTKKTGGCDRPGTSAQGGEDRSLCR
jgi:hypothetical protein